MAQRVQEWAGGQKIVDWKVHRNPGGRYEPMGAKGATILDVRRRGKKMIIFLDNEISLVCHNAMSGFWDASDDPWVFNYVEGRRESSTKDVRVEFVLESGRVLRFHDARLFGSLGSCPTKALPSMLEKMGPEAIRAPRMLEDAPVWCVLDLCLVGGSKKPIKQLLLEQELVAGIGNIYASEGLWRAKVSPFKLGKQMNTQDLTDIFNGVQDVLQEALTFGLDYPKYLRAYRKDTCERCKGPISVKELKGRSTYFCEACQP